MKTDMNKTYNGLRDALLFNEPHYSHYDLWTMLRAERKSKNRKTVVKMLRRALRRNMRRMAAAIVLIVALAACTAPGKLTQGELQVLVAYNRAQHLDVTLQQRIYFIDSTSVWVPCGEGWYCRSRELEQYIDSVALKAVKKPFKQ